MKPLQCTFGQAFTGSSTKRCQDGVVAGSMMCRRHRAEALARVRMNLNPQAVLIRGLRWSRWSTSARRDW